METVGPELGLTRHSALEWTEYGLILNRANSLGDSGILNLDTTIVMVYWASEHDMTRKRSRLKAKTSRDQLGKGLLQ